MKSLLGAIFYPYCPFNTGLPTIVVTTLMYKLNAYTRIYYIGNINLSFSLHVPIVISLFTEHVNWDANDSKIFITHSKQEGLRDRTCPGEWTIVGQKRARAEFIMRARRAGVLPFEKCTAVTHNTTDLEIPAAVFMKNEFPLIYHLIAIIRVLLCKIKQLWW